METTESILRPLESVIESKKICDKPSLSTTQKDYESLKESLKTSKLSLTPLYEIWDTLRQDILTRSEKPKHPTGLNQLDEVLWGLHKKEMLALAARTSQGKSAMSLFLTKSLIEQGQRVVYFSVEMSKEQILERMLTQVIRVNNLLLRRGKCKDRVLEDENCFKVWMDKVKLYIDDKNGYQYDKMVGVIDIMKPDFVFVDYIQMISSRGFKGKMEAVEEYVRQLKELSVERNFGVILVSQVNRTGVESAELHHMKWAGILEEHPDTVVMLKWDWSVSDPKKYIVDVKKQRHGETKNGIVIDFIPEYSLFEDREISVQNKKDFYA